MKSKVSFAKNQNFYLQILIGTHTCSDWNLLFNSYRSTVSF